VEYWAAAPLGAGVAAEDGSGEGDAWGVEAGPEAPPQPAAAKATAIRVRGTVTRQRFRILRFSLIRIQRLVPRGQIR
jgi:hypothetical protein